MHERFFKPGKSIAQRYLSAGHKTATGLSAGLAGGGQVRGGRIWRLWSAAWLATTWLWGALWAAPGAELSRLREGYATRQAGLEAAAGDQAEGLHQLKLAYVQRLRELELFLVDKGRPADLAEVRAELRQKEEQDAAPASAEQGPWVVVRTRSEHCPACNGARRLTKACPNSKCEKGTVTLRGNMGLIEESTLKRPCAVCGGDGVADEACAECRGTGSVQQRSMQYIFDPKELAKPENRGAVPFSQIDPNAQEGDADDASARPAALAGGEYVAPVKPAIPADRQPPANLDRRPRPAGLDFAGSGAALDGYLAGQPPELRALEASRIAYLKEAKPRLVAYMKYLPYGEEGRGLTLSDGRIIRGKIVMTNGESVLVRSLASERTARIAWDQLAVEQLLDCFDYYAGVRVQHGKPKEAALDYLLLAVVAEWYGLGERVEIYLDRCWVNDPVSLEVAQAFLHYLPESGRGVGR